MFILSKPPIMRTSFLPSFLPSFLFIVIFSLFTTSETKAQWRYYVGVDASSECANYGVYYYVEAYSTCDLVQATPQTFSGGPVTPGIPVPLIIPAGWIVRYVSLTTAVSTDIWDCTMGFYHNHCNECPGCVQMDGNGAKISICAEH